MNSIDLSDNSLSIKSAYETDNMCGRKKSDIWKYFGRIFKDDVQLDQLFHCIPCFKEKKIPVK